MKRITTAIIIALACSPSIACDTNKNENIVPDEYIEFAPEWANWAAIRPDNKLCYYETRPQLHHSLEGWESNYGGLVRCVKSDFIPYYWESSLTKINRGEK